MRYLLLNVSVLLSFALFGQNDTLMWQNFENPFFMDTEVADTAGAPLDMWLNLDLDSAQDANNRPRAWFSAFGFSSVDSGNRVLQSSSWLADTSIRTQNWLISPLILPANGEVVHIEWKSAPRQAPRYLDGYRVMYSYTGRNPEDFFTIKQLVEHEGPAADSSGLGPIPTYSWFEFSGGGDIHGIDGQNIELPPNGDSTAFIGELWKPDVISFPAYANDTLYLAFVHDSKDDNLLAIDDILITGASLISVDEHLSELPQLYPNPAKGEVFIEIEYFENPVVLFDALGREHRVPYEWTPHGLRLDVRDLTSGTYWVKFSTGMVSFVKG